jgi:nicotinate-nucleotide pyrophosphorylase (carboxylating)
MTHSAPALARLIDLALDEDLADHGDLTGNLVPDRTATLALVARAPGVLAGMATVGAVLGAVALRLGTSPPRIVGALADGARLEPGTVIARVEGRARVLLAAERTLLNFLTHLSGVATATRAAVEEIAGTGALLRDTRKTTPGMRALEKAAVRAGGGHNHRLALDDAILVKDNHLAMAPMTTLVAAARASHPNLPLEVEVDDLLALEEALELGVDLVLLDNFGLGDLRAAVRLTAGRAALEASGGLRPGSLRAVADTGVTYIAVGWITHSAPALDIGLDWTR